MRKIEKQAKKNPVDENGLPVPSRNSNSKKVKQMLAQQQKQKAAADKEAAKIYQDGLTRHRSIQTQETRDRMDRHIKETNRRQSKQKDFFVVRWFRPKDEIEKKEKQQAKETQKSMAATRKQAEKNNKDMGLSRRTAKTKERKRPLPSPNDMPQGGGGVYREGSSKKFASPNNVQHGGGGSYVAGSSKSNIKASDYQQGGGGTYQTGKSNIGVKASDFQQGGGGKMPKNSKKNKTMKKK